jgi:alpha-galactosidase
MTGAPIEQEPTASKAWFDAIFAEQAGRPLPISFFYDGRESAEILPRWRREPPAASAAGRQQLVLTDPVSGLQLRLEVSRFQDFPAIEWVVYFRNTGSEPTPILSDIQSLDLTLPATPEEPCRLHHALGSECRLEDFAPQETPLPPGGAAHLGSKTGRSSEGALPFFNLETGDRGIIGAIGWTGGWAARLDREPGGSVRLRAGLRRTHLRLLPGEEIRLPRILLLYWERDRWLGQNMLRRFLLAHHTPRPDAPMCDSTWGGVLAQDHSARARWWKENDLPLDCYWIDAGWYGGRADPGGTPLLNQGWSWYQQAGDWSPDPRGYPEGLAPVGRAVQEAGLGLVLWLEPERVFKGTPWAQEHSDCLLGPVSDNYLLDLGRPEARRAMVDLVSSVIREAKVTWYRQDFNLDPAPFWEAADPPDRVGLSEIRHIVGLYAVWDELLARHPGLRIDNCSSGGRRIDLETISRSVPLWRSDYQCAPAFDPISQQAQLQGLAPWVPLSTGACEQPSTYAFRSALGPGLVFTGDLWHSQYPPVYPASWLKERMAELVILRPYFLGDFYPLLSYSLADDGWAAWQFDRPDLGEGMVLALRRQRSPFIQMQPPLCGLAREARYQVRSCDGGETAIHDGRRLMEQGIPVCIEQQPGSALLVYRRI